MPRGRTASPDRAIPPAAAAAIVVLWAALACGPAADDEAVASDPALTPATGGADPETGAASVAPPAALSIVFDAAPESPTFGTVAVQGIAPSLIRGLEHGDPDREQWSGILAVHALPAGEDTVDPDLPATFGDHWVEAEGIRFRPRFPFAVGVRYRARFDGAALDRLSGIEPGTTGSAEADFTMPEPRRRDATRVAAVHPAGGVVPENLLRVYVQFSAPVRADGVAGNIRLYDAAGEEVEAPFVEVEPGLWDAERRRLTLIFHPGRIKRGVGPNAVMGPALRAGETYRLVVDPAIRDESGNPLAEGAEVELRVVAADRRQPVVDEVEVTPPRSPRGAVVVRFAERLDHALLGRLIHVEDQTGAVLEGEVAVGDGERRWAFRPSSDWSSGEYRVVIDPALEDLAGNTFARLFDVSADDATAEGAPAADDHDAGPAIALSFRVGSEP